MLKNILFTRFPKANALIPFGFSSKKQNRSPKQNNQQAQKTPQIYVKTVPSQINIKLNNLENRMNQFAQQYDLFSSAAKSSPLNFVSLFARSCLIANSKVPLDEAFITIKKSINNQKNQLSPSSCTRLMESLVYYKFEGDEGKILNKLCQYYHNHYSLFTQSQQVVFWESYVRIMADKVHSRIQFKNLQRKNYNTLEFATLNQIVNQSINSSTLNRKIIRKITYEGDNVMLIELNKPNNSKRVLLKIKGIPNVNHLQSENQSRISKNAREVILEEIRNLNSNLKKGWNTIIYGQTLQNQTTKTQYKYKYVDFPNKLNENEGYWKSQKVQQKLQIKQDDLNDEQYIQQLRQSNQYIQGIYYNSANINTQKIDLMATLMLGVNDKNLKQSGIKYIQKKRISQDGQFKQLFSYISSTQLRQCYGYAKMCEFQWKLFDEYVNLQNIINTIYKNQKDQYSKIAFYKQLVEQMNLDNQQLKKHVINDTQMMSQMSVFAANNVQNVIFQKSHNRNYKDVYRYPAHYAADLHWQMKPMLSDTIKIINSVESLIGDPSNSKQQQKIMIVTLQQYIPYLVQNLLQAKYWAIPKYSNTNQTQIEAKNILFRQLFKSQL